MSNEQAENLQAIVDAMLKGDPTAYAFFVCLLFGVVFIRTLLRFALIMTWPTAEAKVVKCGETPEDPNALVDVRYPFASMVGATYEYTVDGKTYASHRISGWSEVLNFFVRGAYATHTLKTGPDGTLRISYKRKNPLFAYAFCPGVKDLVICIIVIAVAFSGAAYFWDLATQ